MAKKANQFERIKKHHHDDGYTTYHEDGTTSETTKDLIGDGYTTRKNGSVTSRSRKRKTLSGDEVIETTYEDGSRSVTVKEKDGSYRTQHSNGTETRTTKDTFGTGYTTSDSYPSSGDLFGQVSPDSAGGDVLLPIMAILGVFSIISLFKIKFAVLLLPLLVASIILRIILTHKYKTGIFFLWFHPVTLLCWRLLCRSYAAFHESSRLEDEVLQGFGMMCAFSAILFIGIMGLFEGDDSDKYLLYRVYAFLCFLGCMLDALGGVPLYRTMLVIFGISLLATPICLLVRWKKKTAPKTMEIPDYVKKVQDGINDRYLYDKECYNSYNYNDWPTKWNKTTTYGKLFAIWNAQGRPSDRNIATISGNYLVTMSSIFGNDGDRITIVLCGGERLSAIIVCTSYFGRWLCDREFVSKDIIRFQTKSVPIDLTGWKGKKVVKVINHGPCEELKEIKYIFIR